MKNKIFSFKEVGFKFNVDAQIAGEAIETIQGQNGGKCKPEDVVATAQDVGNPLHSVFCWNDAEEAHKHRLHIARLLIGSIVVTYKHHEEVRANYSVKFIDSIDKENRAYIGVEEAVKPDYELQFRQEACNHLKVFIKRYQSFDYLQTEVQQVQLVVDKMQTQIDALEKAEAVTA